MPGNSEAAAEPGLGELRHETPSPVWALGFLCAPPERGPWRRLLFRPCKVGSWSGAHGSGQKSFGEPVGPSAAWRRLSGKHVPAWAEHFTEGTGPRGELPALETPPCLPVLAQPCPALAGQLGLRFPCDPSPECLPGAQALAACKSPGGFLTETSNRPTEDWGAGLWLVSGKQALPSQAGWTEAFSTARETELGWEGWSSALG